MNRHQGSRDVVRVAILFAISLAALGLSNPPAWGIVTQYQFVDLGTGPAGFLSAGVRGAGGGIQAGWGYQLVSGGARRQRAVLWGGSADSAVSLNAAILTESAAEGTDRAQQVGWGLSPYWGTIIGQEHALLWSGTAESMVDLHPAGFIQSRALGVSSGQQVGYGSPSLIGGGHALLWSGTTSSVVDLHPQGYGSSAAYGITDGQQVGGVGSPHSYAALWKGSADTLVVLHPSAFPDSVALGTSGDQQVGYARTEDGSMRAFVWRGTAESAVDLHPDGYDSSWANGVRNGVQVGGGTLTGEDDPPHALLWVGTAESVIDLHAFVPPEFSRSNAFAIDETARVFGGVYDLSTGNSHAAMWVPVPEPTSILALALCAGAWRSRRGARRWLKR